MTITINGQDHDVGAETLAALMTAIGLDDAVVATALNGTFVTKGRRGQVALRDGDRVEILAPMQGG